PVAKRVAVGVAANIERRHCHSERGIGGMLRRVNQDMNTSHICLIGKEEEEIDGSIEKHMNIVSSVRKFGIDLEE
ncbi:hypothetical protein PMAYCL1PPCAC_02127, partial [Pristionchus mayeri]